MGDTVSDVEDFRQLNFFAAKRSLFLKIQHMGAYSAARTISGGIQKRTLTRRKPSISWR
jgi:hypothetical protein